MEQKLKETLEKLGIVYLSNIQSFEKNIVKYDGKKVNPSEIDNDCNKLILFDNSNYNETYLIDVFEKFINDENNKKHTEQFGKYRVYYCDDLQTRVLYGSFFKYGNMKFAQDLNKMFQIMKNSVLPESSYEHLVERDVICPTITIATMENTAYTRSENLLSVLSEQDFINLSEKMMS